MIIIFYFLTLLNFSISQEVPSLELPSIDEAGPINIQINPRGTYLNTSFEDADPEDPSFLLLDLRSQSHADYVIKPGDRLIIKALGFYKPAFDREENGEELIFEDDIDNMIAVFSGPNGYIAPAIGSTVESIVTKPNFPDGITTDIPQDFAVQSNEEQILVVPEGADRILFSVNDDFFSDNSDPDENLQALLTVEIVSDLRVDNISLIQTIINPDLDLNNFDPGDGEKVDNELTGDGIIDLVKDKPATVLLEGSWSGVEVEDPFEAVIIIRNLETGEEINYSLGTVNLTSSSGSDKVQIPIPTGVTGQFVLQIIIDPQNIIPEIDEDNNLSEVLRYQVIQTYGLDIITFNIGCITGCYTPSSVEESNAILGNQGYLQFLRDIFPVSNNTSGLSMVSGGLFNTFSDNNLLAFDDNGVPDSLSIGTLLDIQALEISRRVNNKRKVVGFIDKSYVNYHNQNFPVELQNNYLGIVLYNYSSVILATDGQEMTLAHELGHTLGQRAEFYKDIDNDGLADFFVPIGINFDEERTFYNARTGQSFTNRFDIMAPYFNDTDYTDYWVSNNTYLKTLYTMTQTEIDPEILVIKGLVSKNSDITSLEIEEYEAGLLTVNNEEGDVIFKTLDNSGNIINTVKQKFDFGYTKFHGSGGNVVGELSTIPLVVVMEKTGRESTVSIEKDGVIIEEIQIDDRLSLNEIINGLSISSIRGKWFWSRYIRRYIIQSTYKRYKVSRDNKRKSKYFLRILRRYCKRWLKSNIYYNNQNMNKKDLLNLISEEHRNL